MFITMRESSELTALVDNVDDTRGSMDTGVQRKILGAYTHTISYLLKLEGNITN